MIGGVGLCRDESVSTGDNGPMICRGLLLQRLVTGVRLEQPEALLVILRGDPAFGHFLAEVQDDLLFQSNRLADWLDPGANRLDGLRRRR